ncbi:MAG: DUF3179 domain-containing protein [Deltaproteobacteria bacterium]|nr:MAG: DUF3179 domain-containing protein [Deltaproteobacteria bacterium]
MTLTLAPSGWTYENTFVLYDRETNSLWYPVKDGLLGIGGKFFGKKLPLIDSRDTRFGIWKSSHPDTKVLR